MSNHTEIKLPQSMIDFMDLPEIVNNKIDISVGFLNGDIAQPQFINTFTFIFYQAWLNQQAEIERLKKASDFYDADNMKLIEIHQQQLDEIERLKSLPLKYKRMEFNAKLQQENIELQQQLDALKAKVSEHNESISANCDCDYQANTRRCPTCPKQYMIDLGEHHE